MYQHIYIYSNIIILTIVVGRYVNFIIVYDIGTYE